MRSSLIAVGVFLSFVFCIPFALAIDGAWEKIAPPYYIGQIKDIAVGYNDGDANIFAAEATADGKLWKSIKWGDNLGGETCS
jgi:hypothetical protein